MRQKAEREIRHAAASLKDDSGWYRIDRVRERTSLIRKVFDKTILDMERVKTIQLAVADTEERENPELIRRGEIVYISFFFIDGKPLIEPEPQDGSSPRLPDIRQDGPSVRLEPQNSSNLKHEVESATREPVKSKSETVNITLRGFYRDEWERFEYLCKIREGKRAVHKVWEMICEYNRRDK